MKLSHLRDSNPRPADYESAALPTELKWLLLYTKVMGFPKLVILFPFFRLRVGLAVVQWSVIGLVKNKVLALFISTNSEILHLKSIL
jgi:hypothetical protein